MDEGLKDWVALIRYAPSEEKAMELLSLFMTLDELSEMGGRVTIVRALLEQKMTQREISAHYGVSIAKITRGSNALKRCSEPLKRYLVDRFKLR